MDFFVYQTENNIVGASGRDAQGGREFYTAPRIDLRGKTPLRSFVDAGFAISKTDNSTLSIATGTAMIEGFLISGLNSAFSLGGLSTDGTWYLWLKLIENGGTGLKDSATIEGNTTGAPPAHSVLLGIAVRSSGVMGTPQNSAPTPHPYVGQYTGDGTANRLIFLGWAPKTVILHRSAFLANFPEFFMTFGQGSGILGLRFLGGAAMSNALTLTSENTPGKRPELQATGFLIGGTSGAENNVNTDIWNFLAFP